MKIALRKPVLYALSELLLDRSCRIKDMVRLINEDRAALILPFFRQEPGKQASFSSYIIDSRVDHHLLHVFDGPLRLRVEGSHRIDLISEKLDAERTLFRQRPHIYDRASHGELPGQVHFRAALISSAHQ